MSISFRVGSLDINKIQLIKFPTYCFGIKWKIERRLTVFKQFEDSQSPLRFSDQVLSLLMSRLPC